MNIFEKLQKIQAELEVPKGQFNKFGNYYYRNAEDILAAAKPLCHKHGCLLTIMDRLVNIGDRYYVEAVAQLISSNMTDEPLSVTTTAYAREEETKKGMDAAQITGSASSYARKYALNGLFCLDDVKDADHMNNGKSTVDAIKEMFPGTEEMLDNLTITPADVGMCEECGANMPQARIDYCNEHLDKCICYECQNKKKKGVA